VIRLRVFALIGLVVVAAVGALLVLVPLTRGGRDIAGIQLTTSPSPEVANMAMQGAPSPPTLRAGPVANPTGLYEFGWALLDVHTGDVAGSANRDTLVNTTESMIKPWLAVDYLQRLGTQQPSPQALDELTHMIEDSNDVLASKYYKMDDGPTSIQRLISTCKLKSTSADSNGWSYTRITPGDAARYGKCLSDGTAAGATWTPWLLDKMRHVWGSVKDQFPPQKEGGHWGIVDGLPDVLAQQAAIKNGWTFIVADNRWHLNCMAIHPDWVLTVEMQYYGSSSTSGLQVGADVCASVARQLVYTPEV
jgi:hypothetical protein